MGLCERDFVFYDGQCGLCHRGVKFVLKHDRPPWRFRFAPLRGATFQTVVAPDFPASLSDSVIVRTTEGALVAHSDAWVYILGQLGGGWKTLSRLLALIPRPLRNFAYELVARSRRRLFRRPGSPYPVVPAELRARFEP